MRKHLIFILLIFTINLSGIAQTSWQWAKRGGGGSGNNEGSTEMVTDKNGNLYVLAKVDKSSLPNIDGYVSTNANDQVSLTKWDCNGNRKWTKFFGAPHVFYTFSNALGIDSLGGIYITGTTTTNGYFDNDTTLTSSNFKSWFIVKYDTTGTFQWLSMPQADTVSSGLGGTAIKSGALAMDVAPNGDLFILSRLFPGIFDGSYVISEQSVHLLRFNKDGILLDGTPVDMTFSTDFDGTIRTGNLTSDNSGFKRDHNTGKLYITGEYNIYFGTLTFGSTSLSTSYIPGTSIINNPAFVTVYDQYGNNLWTKQSSNAENRGINFLKSRPQLDDWGNLIIAGGALTNDTFFGHVITNPISTIGMAFFIMSIDSSGNLRWAKNSGWDPGASADLGVITHNNGVITAAGPWTDKLVWDTDTLIGPPTVGYNHIVQINPHTGSILNSDTFRIIGPSFHNTDIIGDNRGNIYVSGGFTNQLIFPTTTISKLGGLFDFYVAKYGPNDCNCVLPILNFNYSATGSNSYSFIYTGSILGVDSIRWEFGDGIIATGITTSHTYSSSTDNYGVSIVVYSGCGIQTLYKLINNNTSIQDAQILNSISVYPNPASESITVEGSDAGSEISIFNILGQKIITIKAKSYQESIFVKDIPNGVYLLHIKNIIGQQATIKFIKE